MSKSLSRPVDPRHERTDREFVADGATLCGEDLGVPHGSMHAVPCYLGSMEIGLSVDEVLTTTRTVRKRLDFGRPVEREVVEECLSLAVQAPNGSARQDWHFVMVSDPGRKAAIADLYRRCMEDVRAAGVPTMQFPEGDVRAERAPAIYSSAQHLEAHVGESPWLLFPCQERRLMDPTSREMAAYYGSILPAVWSFMLAARERGLGTAWTTAHLAKEEEAAEILGIPFETVTQCAMIPVAHTIGVDFKPASRLPLERVVHWDSW